MANDNTNIMPRLLAAGMKTLRKSVLMPSLVNSDYSMEAKAKGSTIDVPLPTAVGVQDVVPSNVLPVPVDQKVALVQVPLNNWKKTDPIALTDKEMKEIDKNKHFLPLQLSEGMKALIEAINASILAEYKGVYGYCGTAGTTPFGAGITDATALRAVLNRQLCPRGSLRNAVIDTNAEANALARPEFSDASQTSDNGDTKREGDIGRKFGLNWFAEDQIPTHSSTVLTAGACTANGAQAVNAGSTDGGRTGTVSIAKATNATPLVKGDIISFANDPQTYVVLADVNLAVGNTTVAIAPALKTAKAGGEAVTLRATHVVNMGFHRDAFAFAMRSLEDDAGDPNIQTMQDPVTKLVLRIEKIRQSKQTVYEIDALWGAKLVRPELAARLAG